MEYEECVADTARVCAEIYLFDVPTVNLILGVIAVLITTRILIRIFTFIADIVPG